jgi:hypothetical protein
MVSISVPIGKQRAYMHCNFPHRTLVVSLSLRRPEFGSRPIHVEFWWRKVAKRVFLRVLRVSPVSISTPMIRTHSINHLPPTLDLEFYQLTASFKTHFKTVIRVSFKRNQCGHQSHSNYNIRNFRTVKRAW